MKSLLLFVFAFGTLCAETTPPPQPAQNIYLEAAMESIVAYDELAAALENVQDISSARAAAPTVSDIVQRILVIASKTANLPPPTQEEESATTLRIAEIDTKTLSERSIGKAVLLLTATDPPCYGSAELREPLYLLIKSLMSEE